MLVLELVFLAAISAKAVAAPPIAEVPPSVCLVEVKGAAVRAAKSLEGRCSGVLIAPRVVVTAGHCFAIGRGEAARESSVNVACGLRSRDLRGGYDFSQGIQGDAVQVSSGGDRRHGHDFAFVRLSRASRITPMKVPFDTAAFRREFLLPSRVSAGNDELDPSLECRFSGFSPTTLKAQGGYATSDQSPKNGLKAFFNGHDFIVQGYGEGIGKLNPGDSGGPLYCKRPTSKAWTLIAVVSAGTGDISLWAPTASEGFLGSFRSLSRAWR